MKTSLLTGMALAALLVPATQPATATAAVREAIGRPAATQSVGFLVHVPVRHESDLEALVAAQSDPKSPIYRHFLSPAQFRASYAPDVRTLRAVATALAAQGFAVARASSQTLAVRGRVANVESTFGVRMQTFRGNAKQRLATLDHINMPTTLARAGAQVVGLRDSHRMHVHSRLRNKPLNRYASNGPYWFDDLKQAYTAPTYTQLDGTGAAIAIVMSNDIYNADIAAAFHHEKFVVNAGKPVPAVHREAVLGGAPFDPNGGSFEGSLDTQMSLGAAPGAAEWLYYTPDLSDTSLLAAYTQVVDDNKVDIVSSSFGGCELFYTAAYSGADETSTLAAYHQIFLQGNAQGITFVASSGDSSGLGCITPDYFDPNAKTVPKFIPGVEYPAADPAVTAVGGTNLVTTTPPSPQPVPARLTSNYVSESEFPDPEIAFDPGNGGGKEVTGGIFGSGSGTSVLFKKPLYQSFVQTHAARRAVPDVSMQMGGCPDVAASCGPDESATVIAFDTPDPANGGFYGVVGTSSSAPEFAGSLALAVQYAHSRLGNVNYELYAESAVNDVFGYPFFHQGIPGNNGVVTEGKSWRGYSRILGVGTPHTRNAIGAHVLEVAGDPQTATNP